MIPNLLVQFDKTLHCTRLASTARKYNKNALSASKQPLTRLSAQKFEYKKNNNNCSLKRNLAKTIWEARLYTDMGKVWMVDLAIVAFNSADTTKKKNKKKPSDNNNDNDDDADERDGSHARTLRRKKKTSQINNIQHSVYAIPSIHPSMIHKRYNINNSAEISLYVY